MTRRRDYRPARSSRLRLVAALPLLTALALPLSTPSAAAAPPQEKPRVQPADYGRWEDLAGPAVLSPDGSWVAYRVLRVDEHFELRVRPVDGSSDVRAFAFGYAQSFSDDGRWLAWRVAVSPQERQRLEAADEPVRQGVGLLDLTTDAEGRTFEEVVTYAFDATGRYLMLAGYAPQEPSGKGADIRVLDLHAGTETTFGNVAEHSWSDSGSRLALVIATGTEAGNGVQLFDAAAGTLRALDSSGSTYRGLAWREDGDDLAVLRSVEPGAEAGDPHSVIAWRGVGGTPTRAELTVETAGVPDDRRIVAHGALGWAEDGSAVSFGMRPAEDDELAGDETVAEDAPGDGDAETPAPAEADGSAAGDAEEPELPGVQIWHSSDVRLFAEQKVAEQRDARRTLLAVWHLADDRVVAVGSDLLDQTELLEGWRIALERSSRPHPWGDMFGRPYHDVWSVDVATGERDRLLERVRYSWAGPGGHYLMTFDGEEYHAIDLDSGETRNVTGMLDAEFANTRYDTPTDLLPPWGFRPVWSADGRVALVTDRYDVWRVNLDGSGGVRLTEGADDEIEHRVIDLDPDEWGMDLDAPIWLSLRGELTERRGIARLDPGVDAPTRLLYDDALIGQLTRAADAEVYSWSRESRTDSPDWFVGGPDLAAATQVSHTNPFADEYAWTRSELVDFDSEWNEPLQAVLLYPVNHDPEQRYPMIVYTYEILAPQLHSWESPNERDYYNFTAWTQEGYFVLLPDIRYRAREPGPSAIAAVRPAVETVVERGLVDGDRVGLIGHSWGGYQATYLPTRIDTFAASVAGAPLTDFVSFMGALHWNPGIAELSHWETGQARMEVPYWEDPEAHERSSPVHGVQDLNTPLLMAFGDADGVVDWDQGTEFFNFARRAGKQMVLLVYEGEDHGFRQKANQIDYHRRILEWFGHYLKGEPAADWIVQGVQLDDLEKEKKRVATQR